MNNLRAGTVYLWMLLPIMVGCSGVVEKSSTSASAVEAVEEENVNYILGTQTFGVRYTFTDKSTLVETAERIREMGSNLLKFGMTRRYWQEDRYALPKQEGIRSLVDLATKEPSVKGVLDMPFGHYQIWVYAFAHEENAWINGLSKEEHDAEYREVHDLALHLLKTYDGTGKTFLFGHWEGDWYLSYTPDQKVTPTKIKGMIDWLNVRQKAIDDAKAIHKDSDVQIYQYTEVNLVQKGMKGEKCLVNDVLPRSRVDYVSYSCYDTIYPHMGDVRKPLHEALDFIESKLPPKSGLKGKRVFIGEYGYSLDKADTPPEAESVCQGCLSCGTGMGVSVCVVLGNVLQ